MDNPLFATVIPPPNRSGEGLTVGRLSRVAQLRGSDLSHHSSAHPKSDHFADGNGDHFALESAVEAAMWPKGRCCGHCGGTRTKPVPNARPMPYWCPDCRRYFSVRTSTTLARSKVPLRKWVIAVYLEMTSPKGISSIALGRTLGIRQNTAWFMLHRIREGWPAGASHEPFAGPVEADETYMGRLEKNKHARDKLRAGRGGVGKTTVAGVRDRATNQVRAQVVPAADRLTLHAFVHAHASRGAAVYTDEASAYEGIAHVHESVRHGAGEYVRGDVSTNGMEGFWSILKRAHKGTYHKMSPKHLDRYVRGFAGKHNCRELGTLGRMRHAVGNLRGQRLTYRELTAPNGLPSGARGG